MIFQSYKPKIGKKLLLVLLALTISIPILQQPLQAYADNSSALSQVNWDAAARSIVNSTSDGSTVGNSHITNGINIDRTGYLCYMVDAKTGAPTSEAKAFYAGTNWIAGSQWIASTRHGGLTVSSFSGQAEWGQPWIPSSSGGTSGSVIPREPEIKQWFAEYGDNFVMQQFPSNHTKFTTNDELLAVETLINIQFSKKGGSISASQLAQQTISNYANDAVLCIKLSSLGYPRVYNQYKFFSQKIKECYDKGDDGTAGIYETLQLKLVSSARNLLLSALTRAYEEQGAGEGREMLGSPVIGTVPNVLAYDQWNTTVFDSYLNCGIPHAEKIDYTEAGFEAWTGGRVPLSDAQVNQYGVAMLLIHCRDAAQTTCDEGKLPVPHNPPDESDGTKRIIKNYRTRNLTTNELTEDGNNFIIEEVSADILIEDEDTYTVVAWATSSGSSFIPSPTWESSIPSTGTLTQKGLSSGSVKLADPNEKTLYVLLEKPDSEEVEELDYNYLMTQSMITRTVWENYPDEEGAGWEYLKDYDFTWTSAEHPKTCDGHSCVHDLGDDCEGDDTDGDGVDDITWCGGHDDTHPCKFNKYSDSDIKFSLYNYFKDDYPDILATKEGTFRGIEVPFGEEDMLLKRWEPFYSWNLTDRPEDKMHTEDIYETSAEVDWEYISVLMRGKDKLTVAQWANAGEAFYEATSANEDLKDASESGFEVANTKTGTRKTDVYYESFDEFFDTEGDVYTEVEPKDAASEGYCDHCDNKWHCTEGHNYILSTTMTVHVVVKLETYSGNPSGGYADNSLDDSEIIVFGNSISSEGFKSGSQNTHSGRQVKSGGSISFLPYTLMKYQTLASGTQGYHDTLEDYLSGWLRAYVLGQYYRSIIPNDYAEINWTRKSGDNLTLTSTQWSTHALATDAWGTNNVLPGGATLGLKIKESDRQHIYLTTYQCYVDGKGKNQCEVTGGTTGEDSGMSLADAQGNHSAFVYEFADALDNTNVQQWQNKNPHKDVAWDGGQKVNRNGSNTDSSTWDISRLDVSGTKTSSDSKYYFGDHYEGSGKGDYDVDVKETITHTYTFTSDVDGNIHMYIDNVSPSEGDTDAGAYSATAEIINDRTGVRDKLIAAVEQAVNGDYTLGDNKQVCSDEKALNGEKWYNEAFDGITVVVQETHIVSGFVDPFERTEILDPKLTKVQSSKSGQMGMSLEENDKAGRQATYELGQFKTREYSESYRMYQVMSSFKNKYVQMKDLEYLYWSRKFWIPNFTVQDIY